METYKNNLEKMEDFINDPEVGFAIRDGCDFLGRFLMGQVQHCFEILERILPDKDSEGKPFDKQNYIRLFSSALYSECSNIKYNFNFNMDTIPPNEQAKLYKALRLGEIMLCKWNDCLERNCWETRKAFCDMDHSGPDWLQKGSKPHIKLSIEKGDSK